jgi:hypothetical protein
MLEKYEDTWELIYHVQLPDQMMSAVFELLSFETCTDTRPSQKV